MAPRYKLPRRVKLRKKARIRNIFVIDGDSLEGTLPSGERCEIRLAGIDAPELTQSYGVDACDFLESMIDRSAVIYVHDVDDYDRLVAEVYSGRGHNGSLNVRMIRAGYAHRYSRFVQLDGAENAEAEARRKKRGMWASSERPEQPWRFREREEANNSYDTEIKHREDQSSTARGSYNRRSAGAGCLTVLVRGVLLVVTAVAILAIL